jgi:hypothetical protein
MTDEPGDDFLESFWPDDHGPKPPPITSRLNVAAVDQLDASMRALVDPMHLAELRAIIVRLEARGRFGPARALRRVVVMLERFAAMLLLADNNMLDGDDGTAA